MGIDENALNKFVTASYETLRNEAFHGSVSVSHLGFGRLEGIEYDIAAVPRLSFSAPGSTDESSSSMAGVDLAVDDFALSLHYSDSVPPTVLRGSVRAAIMVVADSNGFLVPQLGTVTIDIPGEEKLTEITNKLVVPFMERKLRDELLAPIRVPPLGDGHLKLTGPVLTSGSGRILATTLMAPIGAAPVPAPAPVSAAWPNDRLFIATDFDFINRAAAIVAPRTKPVKGSWSKRKKFGPISTTLKVDYDATIASITLSPVAGQPDQVKGTAAVNTSIHAYAKNLASATGKGTTTVGLTCKTALSPDHELAIHLISLDQFTPKINVRNVPSWLENNFAELLAAMSVKFRDEISAMLRMQPPVKLGSLPSFPITISGTAVAIGVTQTAVTTINAPDGRAFLAATGVPDVHKSP